MDGAGVDGQDSGRPLEEVAGEIVGLAGRLAASMCRWLELVAEFDRREGWLESGCHSCAHWLSWKCGIALQTGREQVRVARGLDGLPLVRAAFGRGELSYTKVRALVRMCTPDTEAELVELAGVATGEHLNRIAVAHRRATEEPGDSGPRRSFRMQWDDHGQLRLSAVLDAETGRALLAALHHAARISAGGEEPAAATGAAAAAPGQPVASERLDPVELLDAGLAESFGAMVQLALAATADESSQPPPPDVVVAVSVDDLRADRAEPVDSPGCALPRQRRGRFHLRAPSRHVDPNLARRLCCDATLTPLVHDGRGSPIDLGRRQRTVNHALRTALTLRDGGCRFPGCGHTRFVHAHHVVHWAHGGPTSLDNLLTLCSFHHRLVHDRGLTAAYALDGTLRLVDLRGRIVAEDRVEVPVGATAVLAPAAGSLESSWGGERLDLGLAIDAILWAEEAGRRRAEPEPERVHADAAAAA